MNPIEWIKKNVRVSFRIEQVLWIGAIPYVDWRYESFNVGICILIFNIDLRVYIEKNSSDSDGTDGVI